MPKHWTYADVDAAQDLRQGDILQTTPELQALFDDVHPWFSKDKYLAFMVTTQTCDLVRRQGGPCAARYINLAAVRGLQECFEQLLAATIKPLAPRSYRKDDKNRAEQLFERILNQNEQKLGLFYLYPDAAIGIGEDAVAFLRVTVAFRADHYETMLGSRRGRLDPEFANKLGWLTGNLYSRIGVPEWGDNSESKIEYSHKLREYIDDEEQCAIRWLSSSEARQLKKEGLQGDAPTDAQLQTWRETEFRKKMTATIDVVINSLRTVLGDIPKEKADAIRKHLQSNSAFQSLLKKRD